MAGSASADGPEHNIVFTSLVAGDKDIVGLVAYSLYKQNKYDWLMAFSRHKNRMPNPDEVQSYLLGESTARRLATYRHLAEATLDGRGVDVQAPHPHAAPSTPRTRPLAARFDPAPDRSGLHPSRRLLIAIIVTILVLIGLIWAFHTGSAPPSK